MKSRTTRYIGIAFLWTWFFWIAAFLMGRYGPVQLNTGQTLFELLSQILKGQFSVMQIFFAIAVFGPALGYLAVGGSRNPVCRTFKSDRGYFTTNREMGAVALLIPFIVALPTTVACLSTQKITLPPNGVSGLVLTIGLYFICNVLTSGTEEFGWRGYLYPALKNSEKTFWSISLKGGLIWAVWHFPVMLIFYQTMPLVALIPTLVGFTASIIAMNYISNFIYERVRSLPLMMLFHGLNNTVSFALLLMFPTNPFMILINIAPWIIVAFIDKRYKP